MTFFKGLAVSFFTTVLGAPLVSASPCAPFSASVDASPLDFLDRADPITVRVTQSLEAQLLQDQIENPEAGTLQKHYCRVGMFTLEIRFMQPLLDDSFAAMVTEAVYTWDAAQEPAGWVISHLRSQPMCARGPEPFAPVCN